MPVSLNTFLPHFLSNAFDLKNPTLQTFYPRDSQNKQRNISSEDLESIHDSLLFGEDLVKNSNFPNEEGIQAQNIHYVLNKKKSPPLITLYSFLPARMKERSEFLHISCFHDRKLELTLLRILPHIANRDTLQNNHICPLNPLLFSKRKP